MKTLLATAVLLLAGIFCLTLQNSGLAWHQEEMAVSVNHVDLRYTMDFMQQFADYDTLGSFNRGAERAK